MLAAISAALAHEHDDDASPRACPNWSSDTATPPLEQLASKDVELLPRRSCPL
jgi:hypothetical protein